MSDDEFLDTAFEVSEADAEPAHTVRLARTFPTYRETMNISAYPVIRLIVITVPEVTAPGGYTIPGVIRELPIGFRDMASAERVRGKFERTVGSYENEGWVRA